MGELLILRSFVVRQFHLISLLGDSPIGECTYQNGACSIALHFKIFQVMIVYGGVVANTVFVGIERL